jgi:D-psicose/D-tagatose/L-ribulose 3-epimerase
MNAIGMHYGFWSHNWDEIDYFTLIPKIARLGFDVSEVASA